MFVFVVVLLDGKRVVILMILMRKLICGFVLEIERSKWVCDNKFLDAKISVIRRFADETRNLTTLYAFNNIYCLCLCNFDKIVLRKT